LLAAARAGARVGWGTLAEPLHPHPLHDGLGYCLSSCSLSSTARPSVALSHEIDWNLLPGSYSATIPIPYCTRWSLTLTLTSPQ
jgi:hypothetical protein